MRSQIDLGLLERADLECSLPKLGGMARPNGVVIVSERFWAFASTDGELQEGTMPVRHSRVARIPLLRGLLQLTASMSPLLSGKGIARGRERALLATALLAPFAFLALPPDLEAVAGVGFMVLLVLWLFRGRTLRLHGAEHRAIAATEERRLVATWSGEARPTRFSPRCGTNFAALALPVTAVVDNMWPFAYAPATGLFLALFSIAVTMEIWKAVQHPSGLLRGLLLPGLALQRLTTREPSVEDTQVALRAVSAVLRRELA